MPVDLTFAIDTPEQVVLELPVAGVGSRFLAVAFDTVLQIIAYFVMLIGALLVQLFLLSRGSFGMAAPVTAILGFFLLFWGYFIVFELWWDGRTPGKRLAGIRVIKNGGRPIGWYEAFARNIVRVVDLVPGIYAIGVVTMLIDRRSRRLGDFVAGTLVVYERRDGIAHSLLTMPDVAPENSIPLDRLARVTADERALVDAFLQRRYELDPIVRDDMAGRIVKRLAGKLEVQAGDQHANEAILEAVAAAARDRVYRPTL